MPMSIQASAALPCVFSRFSRRLGRAIPLRPAVDCDGVCTGCPWSRAEKQRRRQSGQWRRGEDGLLRLHFKPIKGNPENKEERT